MLTTLAMKEVIFPETFLFGAGGAGHQIEGDNVHSQYNQWERENRPNFPVKSGKACNHWEMYKEDIEMMAAMKLQIIDGLIAQREVEEEGSMYSLEDDDEYGRPDSASVPGGMASPTSTSSSAMLMVGARPVTVAHCCIMLLLLLALLLLVPLFSSSRGFCCDLCVCGIRSGRASHPCSARAGRRSPSRETWPRRCACCEWPRPGSWRACERASGVADSGSSGGCRINT